MLVCSSLSQEAAADPTEDPTAWKARADGAFDSRRYAEALELYRRALQKNRDARLHYNIAQALSALERYPEALVSYQAFIAEAPPGTLNEAQQSQLFALVEELKGKIARIEVRCRVPGVRVLVNGRALRGDDLRQPLVVSAGAVKVEAIAQGYKPFETTLMLEGRSSRSLDVTLTRIDFTGALAVESNVAGARVFVDERPVGTAPVEVRVKQGVHVVEIRAREHVSRRQAANVEAGKRARVSLELERAPDYTVAYLGFGIGAVGVAAGTVTGILALTRFDKAKEQCDQATKECGPAAQDDLQASRSWGVLSTVAFGVGAVGIGVGSYGLLNAKRERSATSSWGIGLTSAGLGVGSRF